MGAEHIIEVFLFCSVVFALSGNPRTEQIAVKLEACICVRDGDGRVIDPEKQVASAAMPFRISLPSGNSRISIGCSSGSLK